MFVCFCLFSLRLKATSEVASLSHALFTSAKKNFRAKSKSHNCSHMWMHLWNRWSFGLIMCGEMAEKYTHFCLDRHFRMTLYDFVATGRRCEWGVMVLWSPHPHQPQIWKYVLTQFHVVLGVFVIFLLGAKVIDPIFFFALSLHFWMFWAIWNTFQTWLNPPPRNKVALSASKPCAYSPVTNEFLGALITFIFTCSLLLCHHCTEPNGGGLPYWITTASSCQNWWKKFSPSCWKRVHWCNHAWCSHVCQLLGKGYANWALVP